MTDQEPKIVDLNPKSSVDTLTESTRTAEGLPEHSVQERITKILSIVKEKLPQTTQEFLLHKDKVALTDSVEPLLQSLTELPNLNDEQLKKVQEYLKVINTGIRTINLKNFGPQSKLHEIDDKMAFVEINREIDKLNKDIQTKLIENQFIAKNSTMESASLSEDIAAD